MAVQRTLSHPAFSGAAPPVKAERRRSPGPSRFAEAPFLVIWETTRACDLACRHCRAEAVPDRHPDELTTAEAKALLERVRAFGPILFVFSGGDCLKRPDLVELVEHGAKLGLRMAATPATTPLATPGTLRRLAEAGLVRLAVSLDGPDAELHDAFRRVRGSFDHGLRILEAARDVGLTTQVNTVVARHDLEHIADTAELLAGLGIVFWEVFFLVPMGRAGLRDLPTAREFEEVLGDLYEISRTAPFDVKATAAPHFNRVLAQRRAAERKGRAAGESAGGSSPGHRPEGDGIGRARNVNDGDGFLFVSRTGDIMPSGFLPLPAGNVRRDDLVEVYRRSALFRELRDRGRIKGKCGACEFLAVCGGSRARAYAMTGDWLESEPCCAYLPASWRSRAGAGTGHRDPP